MCAEDTIHGRRRFCQYTRKVLPAGVQTNLVGADPRRVAIMVTVSSYLITQPQSAGVALVPRDAGNNSVDAYSFTLYNPHAEFRVEDWGTMVIGPWDAVNADSANQTAWIVEVLVNESDAQLRGP